MSGRGIFIGDRLQILIEAAWRATFLLMLAGDGEKPGNVVTVGGGKGVLNTPDFAEHFVADGGGMRGVSR